MHGHKILSELKILLTISTFLNIDMMCDNINL